MHMSIGHLHTLDVTAYVHHVDGENIHFLKAYIIFICLQIIDDDDDEDEDEYDDLAEPPYESILESLEKRYDITCIDYG